MVVMGDYINNVFKLFRKHYTENYTKYIALVLAIFFVPLMFSYFDRSATVAVSIGSALLMFSIGYVLYLTVGSMRSRYTFIMDNTLPVSAAERYAFIMLNSTVVLLAVFVLCYLASVKLSMAMFPITEEFVWVGDALFLANYKSMIGMMGTHAVLLAVTLLPSRRIVTRYIVALLLLAVYQTLLSIYVDAVDREGVKLISNIVITIISWVGCYFLVRNYQCKG